MQNSNDIKVRKLKTKDLFQCLNLLKPQLDVQKLRKLLSDRPREEDYGLENVDKYAIARQEFSQQLTTYVLTAFADIITDDAFRKWIADLGGMTLKEFDDTELDATFVIIAKLIEENDLLDFFNRVSDMITKSFGNRFTTSNNVTDG
jgi:hypothetical protein